jgi:hypothetical protein
MAAEMQSIRISQLPVVIKRRMKETRPPVEWSEACRLLAACRSIDEAKRFSDLGEALAAWALIKRSKEAAIEARKTITYAYHRMGTLAKQVIVQRKTGTRGPGPGGRSVLIAHGLTASQASAATAVAKRDIDELLARNPVPAPQTVRHERFGTHARDPWDAFLKNSHGSVFRAAIGRTSATTLGKQSKSNMKSIKRFIAEVREWLDALEAACGAG